MTSEAGHGRAATRPGLTPYLAVHDARGALDWYVDVFGAQRSLDPIVMPRLACSDPPHVVARQ